ncbi:triosephosphate isomerase [Candidatus Kuenenbacteria bacterium]|nr:triosephosphate isomerase [Candidatus Kuenenbacteria bacterium]
MLFIANWKMNLTKKETLELTKEIVKKITFYDKRKIDIVLCPSFTTLSDVQKFLSKKLQASDDIMSESRSRRFSRLSDKSSELKRRDTSYKLSLGAQDVFWEENGAFTGEISASMLKETGCQYVIIGHSDRRKHLKETDEMINKKVLMALKAGLKVILCVGENLLIHNRGKKAIKKFIKNQIEKNLKNLVQNSIHQPANKIKNLIIVYEPIWAISSNKNSIFCYPQDALEIIKFIKQILNSKFHILHSCVLYGGSVDRTNIKSITDQPTIDGVLVGGASLKIDEVMGMIKKIN